MRVKSAKTVLFASLIAAMILPFSAIGFVEAEQVTEKTSVRNSIEAKMQEQVRKDQDDTRQYTSDEYGIPYSLIFEENGKLIVGLDAKKTTEFKEQYSESDVQNDIGTSLDLDVKYYAFERQASVRGGDALSNNSNGTTITVVKNNKIITTGHAFSKNDIVNAGLVGGIACQEVKITKDKNFDGAYADASYGIDTNNPRCGNTYVNDSIHYNGKNYAVTYGTASDITKNKPIKIAGIKTTSSGYILDTDATIRTPEGILHDQVIGSYTSVKGDSGAPIFEITGSSSAKLLGQHVGRACEVDLHSGTNLQWWCDANSNGGLKFFSPWDQVATHLGI